MPPSLDLKNTYSHADMILSSRNTPRISLRKAASYNANDRGPQSSTSSRFSFNQLIASPPPSPGLPALVPRHGKPVSVHTPRRYVRAFIWITGLVVVVYWACSILQAQGPTVRVGWANHAGEEFEMVGDTELPDFPTPVVITDKKGRSKWTVSIPPDHDFPLEPKLYAEICQQNMEVAMHVEELHAHKHKEHAAHHDYYHVDPNFMDVAEAESHGLLPGPRAQKNMKEEGGGLVGEVRGSLIEAPVCEKSLTFLMETGDAGMGNGLMMLWTAFGLAQREHRAFFIDDTRWAYGKYTNFFAGPPMPLCRPPPRHEMLPCPHHARHLVVSAATLGSTFGGAFNEHFEDPKKMEVYRQKNIFDLARDGYESLFRLRDDDLNFVKNRIADIRNQTILEDSSTALTVGIHVRHGDKHPYEFQYRDAYVPLDRYSTKARSIISAAFPDTSSAAFQKSNVIIASDDPTVYDSDEFSKSASRAQHLIRLAAATPSVPPAGQPAIRPFLEETPGWEGGFFAPMFWSLGKPTGVPATAAPPADTKLGPTAEALRLRELVGRAYVMDLAVVGHASDVVVCTVSSMGCRLLGVIMGWDQAVVAKQWINIDGDYGWRGIEW